jgi:hypothetical protein
MSLMQQASESFEYKRRQAEVIVHSTSYQALRTKKNGKKLQYYKAIVESWMWSQPLPLKLISL